MLSFSRHSSHCIGVCCEMDSERWSHYELSSSIIIWRAKLPTDQHHGPATGCRCRTTHNNPNQQLIQLVALLCLLYFTKASPIMSMYVVKRGGRRESVHFDKITSRVSKLCYGLDPKVSETRIIVALGFVYQRHSSHRTLF